MEDLPELWMQRVCSRRPSAVLALYRPDAVLVATYERQPLQGYAQLARYFKRFLAKPGLCGQIQSEIVQALPCGSEVLSGTYLFRWRGGRAAARYTFVTCPSGRIVAHHSSEMPA
jgi:hypothetical protein